MPLSIVTPVFFTFSAHSSIAVGHKYLFDEDIFVPLQPTSGEAMLEHIKQVSITMFDNTFGEMNGKEILWTIMGLLALYQIVMIKWRLINHARHEQIRHSFMRGALTPMRSGLAQTKRSMDRQFSNSAGLQPSDRTGLDQSTASRSHFGFGGPNRGGISIL